MSNASQTVRSKQVAHVLVDLVLVMLGIIGILVALIGIPSGGC